VLVTHSYGGVVGSEAARNVLKTVVLPPEFQQACIDRTEEASGNKVYVKKLKAGHTPEASVPSEEAEAVDDATKAV
jgi:hypothetical protein